MKALSLRTGAPTVHWEDNTIFLSVVEAKIVTPVGKYIEINVCFLQETFDNGLFILKYDDSVVVPADMSTRLFSGPIIGWSTKLVTGFIFYPTSDT